MKGLTHIKAPMATEIFLDLSSMCLSQERTSSTPNDLALATPFMVLFSILIFMWLFVFVSYFWQEIIIMLYLIRVNRIKPKIEEDFKTLCNVLI